MLGAVSLIEWGDEGDVWDPDAPGEQLALAFAPPRSRPFVRDLVVIHAEPYRDERTVAVSDAFL